MASEREKREGIGDRGKPAGGRKGKKLEGGGGRRETAYSFFFFLFFFGVELRGIRGEVGVFIQSVC